tara:strand:+ start:2220 stop:2399 length:180 start_codon:yes stop_codon:yes gene_type:complete
MLRVFLASDFDGAHQPFELDLDQADLKALCIALSRFFLMIRYVSYNGEVHEDCDPPLAL